MNKNLSVITLIVLVIFSTNLLAQTNPVQITSGKIVIPGNRQQFGTAEFISEKFSSAANLRNSSDLLWVDVCRQVLECRPGTAFSTQSIFDFYDLQTRGNFTVNGTEYYAFYSNRINFSRSGFVIPQIARKKGLMFFTAPFEASGRMSVCQVSDYGSGCPPDKVLFDGEVKGHGTLRVTLRINFGNFSGMKTYLLLENLDYQFEP